MKWVTYKISDIAKLYNGRAYLMPELLSEGKYRIVRVGNFTGKDEWYYSNMELEDDKYCQKGDLLYKWACTFGPEIWTEEKVIYHYHIWKIVNNKKVDKKFLYYYLKFSSPQWLSGTNGTTMAHITKETMEKKKVVIPINVNEQKNIAKVLENYDSLIENNNKRIKLLETMAEELYKEWINKFKNKIEVVVLKDLLNESFNGGWGKDDAESKYINGGHVIRGTDIPDILNSDYSNVQYRYHSDNDIKNKQLRINDIIIEMSNGNIDNIGRALLITKDILNKFKNVIAASFCKTLRFKNEIAAISTLLLIDYLQKSGKMMFYKNTGTNGINNFNFKRFLRQKVYIIDKYILSNIKNIFDELSYLRNKNEILIQQRDYLLPRLMSGKLLVENKSIV